MLIASAKKHLGALGKSLIIQLLWAYSRLLVTRVNLIYLVDEFSRTPEVDLWFYSSMFLLLVLWMRWNEEGKWAISCPRYLRASPQTYRVCSVCRWLSQLWLAFVLLRADATLGVGCGIWEHLHSFREVITPGFYLLKYTLRFFIYNLDLNVRHRLVFPIKPLHWSSGKTFYRKKIFSIAYVKFIKINVVHTCRHMQS